jgi:hypothetical protein
MNERIAKLIEECTDRHFSEGGGFETFDKEKFAELIVRECMEQVWYTREDSINGNVSEVIKQRIEQHFGVEE